MLSDADKNDIRIMSVGMQTGGRLEQCGVKGQWLSNRPGAGYNGSKLSAMPALKDSPPPSLSFNAVVSLVQWLFW